MISELSMDQEVDYLKYILKTNQQVNINNFNSILEELKQIKNLLKGNNDNNDLQEKKEDEVKIAYKWW